MNEWTDAVLNDSTLPPSARQALLALRRKSDGHNVIRGDVVEIVREYGIQGQSPERAVEEARGSGYLDECENMTVLTLP